MSVKHAMRFIEKIAQDDSLKMKIRSGLSEPDLEFLVKIGAAAGLTFTASDLRSAFAKDWAARWVFYGARRFR